MSGSRRIPDIALPDERLATRSCLPATPRASGRAREILERARRTGDRRVIKAAKQVVILLYRTRAISGSDA